MEPDRILLLEIATTLQNEPKKPDHSKVTDAAALIKECRLDPQSLDKTPEVVNAVIRSAASLLARALARDRHSAIRDAYEILWDATHRWDPELGGGREGYGIGA